MYTKEELLDILKIYFAATNEAGGDILFYSLLGSIYQYIGMPVECVLMVTGCRGSMKTTVSRVVSKHEIKFYSLSATTDKLKELDGNILIDDIFPKNTSYGKQRQAELLNLLVRNGDRSLTNCGIILTAEYMPNELLASGRDRVWEVKMPVSFIEANKEEVWDLLMQIPSDFMEELLALYEKELCENKEDVAHAVKDFLSAYRMPDGLSYKTRFGVHLKMLLLSEYVFRNFFCTGISVYDEQKYCQALTASAIMQQNSVLKREAQIDFVLALNEMLFGGRKCIQVITSLKEYKEHMELNGRCCWLDDGKVWIRRSILLEAASIYLGYVVNKKEFIQALDCVGILEKEGNSVSKSASKIGKRHLSINCELLKMYVKEKRSCDMEGASPYVIDVVRKCGN